MKTLLERLKPQYKNELENGEQKLGASSVNNVMYELSKKINILDVSYGTALELSIILFDKTNPLFAEMLDIFEND
jgi:hypothetical protein